MEHARHGDVRRIAVRAGDHGHPIDLGEGRAGHRPAGGGGRRRPLVDEPDQALAAGQFAEGKRGPGVRADDAAVRDGQRGAIDPAAFGGQIHEYLAGRRDHGVVDAVSLGRREPYARAPERVFVRGAPLLLAYEPGHAGDDK